MLTYSESCYADGLYSECTYSESCYADGLYSECTYSESCYADGLYSECTYAECTYSDSCYADGRYSECRGIKFQVVWQSPKSIASVIKLFFCQWLSGKKVEC